MSTSLAQTHVPLQHASALRASVALDKSPNRLALLRAFAFCEPV